jgi:glycosyltransferase involved in cell wall biosynthesis
MSAPQIQISVVIPLLNEAESLPELVAWIDSVMQKNQFSYELVLVDDGSTDNSWEVILGLKQTYTAIRAFRFQRNYGKSAALHVGFEAARGNVVITMDADLQDSPDEIPDLYEMITTQKFDLVSGWKKKRHDPLSKTIPTRLFNYVTRLISGIRLHDFNCGLKAYRKAVVKSVEIYGEMHRYIPFLAKGAGFRKIGEKVVQHRARKYGYSKFGLERFINGFLDLLTVSFMIRFGRKPMHFFGLMGVFSFLIGFIITTWLIAEKVNRQINNQPYRDVVAQPLFYLALAALIIGVQLFLAGFLGEMIIRNATERNTYLIAEQI